MNGIFLNIKNNLVRLIRFYDDGFVIGTSISLTDFETSNKNLDWFDRKKNQANWSKGNYKLKNDSVSVHTNDYISISFELTLNQNSTLYSGYIINSEKIHLTFEKETENTKSEESDFKWLSNLDYEQLTFNRHTLNNESKINYQGYLGLMMNFGENKLFEEFNKQYVIENGNDKFDKVAQVVKNSEEIKNYINHLKLKAAKPDIEDLQYVINTHKYFRWSKEETVCLAKLATVFIWANSNQDEEKQEIVTEIMAKTIDHCSKLKYNQFNNFFHRFYRRLKIIMDSN